MDILLVLTPRFPSIHLKSGPQGDASFSLSLSRPGPAWEPDGVVDRELWFWHQTRNRARFCHHTQPGLRVLLRRAGCSCLCRERRDEGTCSPARGPPHPTPRGRGSSNARSLPRYLLPAGPWTQSHGPTDPPTPRRATSLSEVPSSSLFGTLRNELCSVQGGKSGHYSGVKPICLC